MSKPDYDVLDRIMTKYYPRKWKQLKEQYYGQTEGETKGEESKESDQADATTGRKTKRRRVH